MSQNPVSWMPPKTGKTSIPNTGQPRGPPEGCSLLPALTSESVCPGAHMRKRPQARVGVRKLWGSGAHWTGQQGPRASSVCHSQWDHWLWTLSPARPSRPRSSSWGSGVSERASASYADPGSQAHSRACTCLPWRPRHPKLPSDGGSLSIAPPRTPLFPASPGPPWGPRSSQGLPSFWE